MRFPLAIALTAIFISLGGTSIARAENLRSACPQNVKAVTYYQERTWSYQDQMSLKRTKSSFNARKVRSCGYTLWVAKLWQKRAFKARKQLRRGQRLASADWAVAVRYADKVFPGTRSWLWSCSASEGAHGHFVMNRQGSGAGGWLQFMSGTFYGNVDSAFAAARQRGFFIPQQARSWYSTLGQAITGAYMLLQNQRHQWTGAGC